MDGNLSVAENMDFFAVMFQEGVAGRRARLRGGPDVREIVAVWRDNAPDRAALAEHFAPHVSPEHLDQALACADRFPGEIDAPIDQSERLERYVSGER